MLGSRVRPLALAACLYVCSSLVLAVAPPKQSQPASQGEVSPPPPYKLCGRSEYVVVEETKRPSMSWSVTAVYSPYFQGGRVPVMTGILDGRRNVFLVRHTFSQKDRTPHALTLDDIMLCLWTEYKKFSPDLLQGIVYEAVVEPITAQTILWAVSRTGPDYFGPLDRRWNPLINTPLGQSAMKVAAGLSRVIYMVELERHLNPRLNYYDLRWYMTRPQQLYGSPSPSESMDPSIGDIIDLTGDSDVDMDVDMPDRNTDIGGSRNEGGQP